MTNAIPNEICDAILASLRADPESLFLNIELMLRRHGEAGVCDYFIKKTPYMLVMHVRPKTRQELEIEAREND